MNINTVIVGGNLTRDPELKYTQSNKAVCSFTIANNKKYTTAGGEKKEEVHFFDCTAWDKTGENINKFFTKGKPICVEGRLVQERWEDKQDGSKRSKLKINVQAFHFCGGDAKGDAPAPASDRVTIDEKNPTGNPMQAAGAAYIEDEEIPF